MRGIDPRISRMLQSHDFTPKNSKLPVINDIENEKLSPLIMSLIRKNFKELIYLVIVSFVDAWYRSQ